jgi:hypothetical protein
LNYPKNNEQSYSDRITAYNIEHFHDFCMVRQPQIAADESDKFLYPTHIHNTDKLGDCHA